MNWEANIWEATAIKAKSSRSRSSVTQALPTTQERQPTFHSSNQEPQGVRFRTSDNRTQQLDCGHSTWPTSTAIWPSESEHVSNSNVKHKSATASDLAPVEQQRAVSLVRTRKIGRQTRTIGERALQTEPDAHQGNVEVVGGHQRSHHRQLCLQHAANSRVQHRRSELTGLEDRTQLRRPDDGSSNRPTKTKAHDQRKRTRIWNPGLADTTSRNSQVTRRRRFDRVGHNTRTHRSAGAQDNPFSGHAARQAADL